MGGRVYHVEDVGIYFVSSSSAPSLIVNSILKTMSSRMLNSAFTTLTLSLFYEYQGIDNFDSFSPILFDFLFS